MKIGKFVALIANNSRFTGNLSENEENSDMDSEENLIFDESSDDEQTKYSNATNGHVVVGKTIVPSNAVIQEYFRIQLDSRFQMAKLTVP